LAYRTLLAAGVLALLAACGPTASTTTQSASTNAASSALTAQTPESNFLDKAAMFETFEIQAAALAVAQAQAQAVKDYAAASATEHSATLQHINELAQASGIAAPSSDLSDDYQAYLDMLRRANGAGFDSIYKSQQALAYINAAGTYNAFASSAADSPLKQWAQTQVAHLQEGVTAARTLEISP